MEPTNATASKTSEGDGLNTEDKAAGAGTQTATTEDAPKFTQADQTRLAEKIRREEKKKYEEKAADEKRLADEAKAKEQGEFQVLADSRQKELDALKPQLETAATELEAYKLAVSEMVAVELKALPDKVRDISPARYAEDKSLTNPLDVLAWLPKGKALADELNGQPVKYGAGRDPKATGGTPQQAYEYSKQKYSESGKYGM